MYSVFKTVQKKGHIGLKTFPYPYTLGKQFEWTISASILKNCFLKFKAKKSEGDSFVTT